MKNNFAVITGAAEGLGRSFALACASQGYHLMLVDLPGKKLPQLAGYIQQSFGNKVIVVEQDLCSKEAATTLASITKKQNLSVSLLINNAGMGLNKLFDSIHESQLSTLLQLNVQSLTQITLALLPHLKENGNATIINVSSLASYYPLPFKSIYAASKAYVRSFSQALRIELQHEGVHVCTLCPGAVVTNGNQFINAQNSGWFAKLSSFHPDDIASIALKNAFRKKAIVIPGILNKLLLMITRLFPTAWKDQLAMQSMKSVTSNSKLLRMQLYQL